jgi:uncharacterized GH25 family protein
MRMNREIPAITITRSAASLFIAALILTASFTSVPAHEVWLEPADFAPAIGKTVPVAVKVGQNLEGESLVFLRKDFPQVAKHAGRRRVSLNGIDGNIPALSVLIRDRGPNIISLVSRVYDLEFEKKEKLAEYLDLEGYAALAATVRATLSNPVDIDEEYERNAKTVLFSDGKRQGRDLRAGLDLEFVFEDDFSRFVAGNTVRVQLLKGGRPLPNIPVKAIAKDRKPAAFFLVTDAAGRVEIPLDTKGRWLINAVLFTRWPSGSSGEIKSVWASYSFDIE